jgi:hypothetical protein
MGHVEGLRKWLSFGDVMVQVGRKVVYGGAETPVLRLGRAANFGGSLLTHYGVGGEETPVLMVRAGRTRLSTIVKSEKIGREDDLTNSELI